MRQHATPVCDSVPFCVLLALVGGFLDAYTYVGRGGVFCNAQTGNVALLGVYLSAGKWQLALYRVPPILAFIAGVFLAEIIKETKTPIRYLDWKRLILIFEIIILFIAGLIPSSASNIFVTTTISFVSSLQVSSFRKLVDTDFNTTMITGNLRSASKALYLAVVKKDADAASRSVRFFVIIFSFLLGALVGGVMTLFVGIRAIWFTILLLLLAAVLLNTEEQQEKAIHNC
jgi:Predicted membrane protein